VNVASRRKKWCSRFDPRQVPTPIFAVVGQARMSYDWPAAGSEDTELGVLMELEVGHGETEVYARVQA
jgi:hypothetical protein